MLGNLLRLFASAPERSIGRVEDRVRSYLEPRSYGRLEVHHFGAIDIHPRNLVLCICVATDAERQQLIDSGIDRLVRTWLSEEHYPEVAIKEVGISIDSKETVDRDWNGDWHQYYK